MMAASLNAVPRKLVQDIPPPGLAGISYPEIVALVETMAAQDARIIFDTMRPFTVNSFSQSAQLTCPALNFFTGCVICFHLEAPRLMRRASSQIGKRPGHFKLFTCFPAEQASPATTATHRSSNKHCPSIFRAAQSVSV